MTKTSIYWYHHQGCAEHEGVVVALRNAPSLPGVQGLTELDFAPDLGVGQLRERCDRTRELSPHEQAACMLILKRVSHAARAAILEPIGPDLKP